MRQPGLHYLLGDSLRVARGGEWHQDKRARQLNMQVAEAEFNMQVAEDESGGNIQATTLLTRYARHRLQRVTAHRPTRPIPIRARLGRGGNRYMYGRVVEPRSASATQPRQQRNLPVDVGGAVTRRLYMVLPIGQGHGQSPHARRAGDHSICSCCAAALPLACAASWDFMGLLLP
jgi:hypothetical protein